MKDKNGSHTLDNDHDLREQKSEDNWTTVNSNGHSNSEITVREQIQQPEDRLDSLQDGSSEAVTGDRLLRRVRILEERLAVIERSISRIDTLSEKFDGQLELVSDRLSLLNDATANMAAIESSTYSPEFPKLPPDEENLYEQAYAIPFHEATDALVVKEEFDSLASDYEYMEDVLGKLEYDKEVIETRLEDLERHLKASGKRSESSSNWDRRFREFRKTIEQLSERIQKIERTTPDPSSVVKKIETRINRAISRPQEEIQRPLPSTPSMTAEAFSSYLEKDGFFVSPSLISEIIRSIQEKRLLVLRGAPRTGKTYLARRLSLLYSNSARDPTESYTFASVDPEWMPSTLIGGIRPIGQGFVPWVGCLSESVIRALEGQGIHWLVLDEINRGNVSSFLAPVLDSLSGLTGSVTHPFLFFNRSNPRCDLPIPSTYRIIGTMNTFDEDQLFNFSDALVSRTAFVTIRPLEEEAERKLLDRRVYQPIYEESRNRSLHFSSFKKRLRVSEVTDGLLSVTSRIRSYSQGESGRAFMACELGTGLVIDAASYAIRYALNLKESKGTLKPQDIDDVVDHAVHTHIIPGLLNVGVDQLNEIADKILVKEKYPNCFSALMNGIYSQKIL